MGLPWRLCGGDKRDDNANIFAAEKIVKYRTIFMALDVSPRNASAAVSAVQSDPKTKRGNSHQRRRQGRRERRQGQKSGAGVFCIFFVELVYFNEPSGGVCISPSK
jgi:hypothetical protein